jgi:HD superfamily phosphohydrolase YqeK
LKNIWEIYPKLTQIMYQVHEGMELNPHNWDHTFRVAQHALNIAESDEVGRLAGAAGLCHGADRILEYQNHTGPATSSVSKVPWEDSLMLLETWLGKSGEFNRNEQTRIIVAIRYHSGPNRENSDPVLDVLQAADRITCSDIGELILTGRFMANLPAYDPIHLMHDASAHPFKNPKSAYRNMLLRFEWADPNDKNFGVRPPKAQALMKERAADLLAFDLAMKRNREQAGMWPYPQEFLDFVAKAQAEQSSR